MFPRKWKWLSASLLNIKLWMWGSEVLLAVNNECEQRDVCACVFSVQLFQFSFHSESKCAFLSPCCKGTQQCFLLWVATIFFIQIHQNWAHSTSLCPTLSCSARCLLSCIYISSCIVTIYISVSGAFNNGCLHVTGDALLRKGQGSLNTNSLLPLLASVWVFSPLLFCQLPALSFPFCCLPQIHIQRCFEHNINTIRANYNCT